MPTLAVVMIWIYFFIAFIGGCARRSNYELARTYYESAALEIEEGNTQKARYFIEKSLEIKPTAQAYALKARLLYMLENLLESAQLFKKVSDDSITPPALKTEALNNYAVIQYRLGNTNGAQKIWHELTHCDAYTTPEVAYYNLGLSAFEADDFKGAINYFLAASTQAPNYIDALFYLGLSYHALEDDQQAIEQFKKILNLMPDHEAANYLAHALLK